MSKDKVLDEGKKARVVAARAAQEAIISNVSSQINAPAVTSPAAAPQAISPVDQQEDHSAFLLSACIEEKEASFLLPGIPSDNITLLVGDGGVGKGLMSCHLAAAITTGRYCCLDSVQDHIPEREAARVILINAEDSFSRVVKQRLTDAQADHSRIITADEDKPVPTIEEVIEAIKAYRPRLAILDPLQSFVPEGAAMERRNVMRKFMQPLQQTAAAYECAILIVMHTNKRTGASGRYRVADSADLWDIARSVFIMGAVNDEENTVYISHEKSNYGKPLKTQLCRIDEAGLYWVGETSKKDHDFVQERDRHSGGRPATQRAEAVQIIIDEIKRKDGVMSNKDLTMIAEQNDISAKTLRNARTELVNSGQLTVEHSGQGKDHKTLYKLNG